MNKIRKIPVLLFLLFMVACNLPQADRGEKTPQAPAEQAVLLAADPQSLAAVSILRPQNGESYPLMTALPVLVSHISPAPLSSLELLVNGESVQTQRGEEIGSRLFWMAEQPGRHNLQVRAITQDGLEITSPGIEIRIDPAPVGYDVLRSIGEGETLSGLATQFGSSPAQILANNPGLAAAGDNDPLPVGLQLRIPVPPILPPGLDAVSETDSTLPIFTAPAAPNFDFEHPATFERVYFYLSLNGSPWSRVPRLPEDFISPANGFFNLDKALEGVVAPPSEGNTLAEIDAWGWSGGTLVYIGRFERVFSAAAGQEPFVILPGKLEICDGADCKNGFGGYAEHATNDGGLHEMRWSPPNGINSGIWQMSRLPFESVCEPESIQVFRSGQVNASGLQTTFSIEFPLAGQDNFNIPIPQPGGGPSFLLNGAALPQQYFVRVLPIVNGKVECSPSNSVSMEVKKAESAVSVATPPTAPTPPVLFDIEISEVTPIHFPKYDDLYCVIVTENPYYVENADLVDGWLGSPYKNIAPGTKLCPQKYVYEEPSFLEKAGSYLKNALNFVSAFYAALKDLAVKLVVKLIPYCYASEFGGSYSDDIDSVCMAASEIIVSTAMTYVGLPPSIPNYDQLADTAKGQITELAVQQFEEQTGLPCIEACRDLIEEGVDNVWDAAETLLTEPQGCMGSAEAHNLGIEPLCLPPTIKTVPPPETLLQPATITVKVTRLADMPNSALPNPELYKTSCRLNISNWAENSSYKGQQVFLGEDYLNGGLVYWTGAPISGEPFGMVSAILNTNELAPGQSQDFSFALSPKRGSFPPVGGSGFWLPGRLELYKEYWYNSGQSANWRADDDWEYLYLGAQLNLTANATCTTTADGLAPASSSAQDSWTEQISSEK